MLAAVRPCCEAEINEHMKSLTHKLSVNVFAFSQQGPGRCRFSYTRKSGSPGNLCSHCAAYPESPQEGSIRGGQSDPLGHEY